MRREASYRNDHGPRRPFRRRAGFGRLAPFVAALLVLFSAGPARAAITVNSTLESASVPGTLRYGLAQVVSANTIFFDFSSTSAIPLSQTTSIPDLYDVVLLLPSYAITFDNSSSGDVTINSTAFASILVYTNAATLNFTGDGKITLIFTSSVADVVAGIGSSTSALTIGTFGSNTSLTVTGSGASEGTIGLLGKGIDITNLDGTITVNSTYTGGASNLYGAWGLKAGRGANSQYSISVGTLSGDIFVSTAGNGNATGLQGKDITVTTLLSGTVEATALGSGNAYGFRASDEMYYSGNLSIENLLGTVEAKSSGGGKAYALYADTNITIGTELKGDVTATAGGNGFAYGLYAGSNVTIKKLSGDITATAQGSGYAYGLYAGSTLTIEGNLTLNGSVLAEASTYGVAVGLYAGQSLLLKGNLAGDVTATGTTATGLAAGGQISITGVLSGTVTAGDISTATAEGLYVASGTISLAGGLSGSVTATADAAGSALGLYVASGSISIAGGVSGSITATAGDAGYAYGLRTIGGAITIDALTSAGKITATVTGAGTAYALSAASGNIAMTAGLAGTVKATAGDAGTAYALAAATGNVAITGGLSGTVSATAGAAGTAYALAAATGGVAITGGLSGSVSSTVTGSGTDYGLYASGGVIAIDTMTSTGTITATTGNGGKAYGLYSAAGAVSITAGLAGTITATAGDAGEAYGIYAATSGNVSIAGGLAGTITATATSTSSNAYAYGIASEAGAITISGGLSKAVSATVTTTASGSGYAYGLKAKTGITIDTVSSGGTITATSLDEDAYGLYVSSGTISITNDMAGTITAETKSSSVGLGTAYGLSASGDISLGNLSGTVTATGGATAYGLRSSGANISIAGALSGTVTAKTTDLDLGIAYGLYAGGSISIGEVSGSILAQVTGTNTGFTREAYGLYAGGNINGGNTSTAMVVSDTIEARAYGPAYAVYSSSGSVNLYVTGSLIGYDTLDSNGYAIYAGGAGSSVTLNLAGAASSSLVGKVHLSGGTLTLLGANSADNLFEGVTSLVVGDGTTTTSWTLNPAFAHSSNFGDLTIMANAALSINEFVSVGYNGFVSVGDIVNNGALTWDLVTKGQTYAGNMSGSGSLTKSGAYTLTLSGSNNYTGATIVSAGTLQAGAEGAFSSSSAVSVATGATLDLNGYKQTIGGLSGSGTVSLGSVTLTVNNTSDSPFDGVISGTGGLTKSGSGTLTLTGANTYTGATTVSAGTLSVTGSLATSSITVASGATLDFSGSLTNLTSLTNSGTINLTSALTFSDADCTIISTGSILAASATDIAIQLGSGNDSVTLGPGATVRGIIDGGGVNTLTLVGSVSLDGEVRNFQNLVKEDTGSWTITGDVALTGSLTVSAGNLTLEGDLTATSVSIASGASLTWANDSTTAYSGVISGAGSLTKSGAGTLTLSGANTYTGATTVSAGSLIVSGSLASSAIDVASGAQFAFDTAAASSYAGVISGAGTLTKSGVGTLTLSGANSYTGATTVSAGSLIVSGSLASSAIDVASGAQLAFDTAAASSYAGVISGAGTLTKSGVGALTLTGTNTYTGATSITGGTLRISSAGNLQGTSGVTLAGGTLQATSTLALDKSIALGSGGGAFEVANSGDTLTLSGVISDAVSGTAGSLTKTGSGTLSLTGTNTYTGGTNINGGTVNIVADANLGDASGGLTFNGGTLQLGADVVSSRAVTLNASGGTFDTNGHDLTLNGTVSGTGGLTKTGLGTLTLSGDATYTGPTSIQAGTLSLGGSSSSSSMDVASGATLNFAPSKNVTYAGSITGSGHITKTGDYALTLSGDNSGFTGDLTLFGGILSISSDANLGASTASLNFNGGTLATTAGMTIAQSITVNAGGGGTLNNAGNDLTLTNSLSGSGDLTFVGSGTVNLGASFNGSAYGGTLSVSGGALHLVDGETLGGTLTITSGATLNGVGTVGNLNVSGVISPGNSPGTITVTGDFAQSGSGTYICQVTPTANDLIAVTGNASLSGTLSIQPEYTYYSSGTVWTVLTTQAGSVSGTYSTVTYGATPENWIFVPVYSATAVTVTLVRQSYSASATNSQASSVGAGLDAVAYNATGEMATLIKNLDYSYGTTTGYLPANALTNYALNVLSSEFYDLFSQNVFAAGRLLTSAQHAGLHEGEEGVGQGFASPLEIGPASLASQNNQYGLTLGLDTRGGGASSLSFGRLGVFVKPIGMRAFQQGSSSQTGYATVSGGITGGVLYRSSPELTLALAPGFVTQSIGIHSEGGGQGTVNDWSLGFLAAYRSGPWHADAGVRGAYNTFQSSRSLPLPSGSYTAKGNWDGWNVNVSTGGGYDFTAGDYTFGPLAAVSWQRLHENAFKESGAGTLGQSVRARNTEALNTVLGARVARTFETPAGDVTPEVRVGWSAQWLGESQNIVASFIGSPGSAYQVKSTNHAYNSALVDIGVSMRVSSSLTATARAGVELLRPGYESQAASLGLKYTF